MSTPSWEAVVAKQAEARALRRVADWCARSRQELSDIVSLFPREEAWEAGMVQAVYLMIDDGLREQFEARAQLAEGVLRSMRSERAAARDLAVIDLLEEAEWAWTGDQWDALRQLWVVTPTDTDLGERAKRLLEEKQREERRERHEEERAALSVAHAQERAVAEGDYPSPA